MTLTELATELYLITGRPDQIALSKSALRASTLKLHSVDFFYKDIVESEIDFIHNYYTQSLDTLTVFPLWRALKYIRTLDVSTVPYTPGKFFELLTPTSILDEYGVERSNVCYQAGTAINIKSDTLFSSAIVGYYTYPDTTEATYSSWIAIEHPWAIIYDAATKILKSLGLDAQAQGTTKFASEYLQELVAANIVAVGE